MCFAGDVGYEVMTWGFVGSGKRGILGQGKGKGKGLGRRTTTIVYYILCTALSILIRMAWYAMLKRRITLCKSIVVHSVGFLHVLLQAVLVSRGTCISWFCFFQERGTI